MALLLPHLSFFTSESRRFELNQIVVYAVLGVALTMVIGWAGQVSLGHFAVVGVGAYTAARLSDAGYSLVSMLAIAGAAGALTLVLCGIPALRVRGMALTVTTLGLAVIGPVWLFRQSWLGTDQPTGVDVTAPRFLTGFGPISSQLGVYYAGLVILAVTLTATAALRRSSAGRASIAVRDNEAAAAAFGLTPASVKLRLLAVSGAAAGMAGVLWALSWASVNTTQFAPGVSLAALAVPVFGGLGSLAGAVIGSVAVFLPTFLLAPHFGAIFGQFGRNQGFQLALSGVGMIGFIMGQPFGIAGAVQNVWERWLVRLARSREERQPQEESLPLVVSGVALSFGGVKALDEVSLAVGPGEIVGLIGGNGAGKTTLMNVVSGVLRPERGGVRIRSEEVIDLAPEFRSALGLGRSFQDARPFSGLTVVETAELAMASGRRSGVLASMVSAPWVRTAERDDRAAALEVLERLGLTAWAGAHTAELSTGTRRICDLAAQVAMGPKVLLLDEPTAGVAQREAEAFAPLLRRIRDELDCSILVIEHDMPLLMGLCDRVYAMEAGAMIAEGTPEEVRNDPRVIASYLGSDEIAMARSGSRPTSAKVARSRRTLSAAKADQ